MEFEVVNIAGTINYPQALDLQALADEFKERSEIKSVTFEPAKNHWLQARFVPDETYVAFYRSGKCSIVGAHSIDHFNSISDRVNGVMAELLDLECQPKGEINNIVAKSDLGNPIPLEALSLKLGFEYVEYEPEQFPALVYRESDHVILVFSSGKMLFTGLVDLERVSEVVNKFAKMVQDLT